MTEQLSEMFCYEEVCCSLFPGTTVLFKEVVLLKDITHPKFGTFPAGTFFYEASLDFPSLEITFYSDHPHVGYITELEIDVRVEQDL